MKIYFEKDDSNKEFKLDKSMKIKDVLNKFDIVSESVILVKNGEVCLDDALIEDKDELKILAVVSGG